MTKSELRKAYLTKRKELSSQFVKIESLKISDIFSQNFDFEDKVVHCFIPIAKNNEIDTWLLIDRIMEKGKVVVPKANFENSSMTHFYFEKDTELIQNQHGILEPNNAELCGIEDIDVVLLPLLTFDNDGYRVGYGGGFYDRFLSQLPSKTQLIGLSLFEPVDEIKDLNTFDKKMHHCITPTEIYSFE
ncbi:MAG: 5-formyltetrahydrofolate cyclo-ligase [Flavobacteriales bacterium]